MKDMKDDVLERFDSDIDESLPLSKSLFCAVNSSVLLHDLLHIISNNRSGELSSGVSRRKKKRN